MPKTKSDSEVVIVKERGVNSKGFGHIAKRVMTDPNLTITAKGIYCYLSSMAGSEETSFTRRSKILLDLVIGERAYDSNIVKLQSCGYITRAQGRKADGSFGTTLIEFIMIPAHLEKEILEAQEKETAPTMYSGTVYALGWGSIPRVVMQDKDISVKAKGLYGYICAYAGATGEAFPSRPQIIKELSINKDSYTAYKKELEIKKYVSVVQSHVDGLLARNFFRINMFPEKIESQEKKKGHSIQVLNTSGTDNKEHSNAGTDDQCPKNSSAADQCPKNSSAADQCPKNSSTADQCPENSSTADQCPKNQCTVNQCPENQCTENPGTPSYITNNILPNNSSPINTPSNNILHDRLIDQIRSKIDFEIMQFCYNGDKTALDGIDLLVSEVVRVLTARESRMIVNKQPMITASVRQTLMEINNTAAMNVIERYLAYQGNVQNPGAYLLSAIYNELTNPTQPEVEDLLEI